MFVKNNNGLIVGGKYKLKKEYIDVLTKDKFIPPHIFIYKGVSGIGDHQDQYEFVDDEKHMIAFCPALREFCGIWSDYLELVE